MDPFVGEIRLFAGNFAPKGWAFCEGQILPLARNTALFSLLGTSYGGDGKTTFALPDLRSAVAVGAGETPQGFQTGLGEAGGDEPASTAPTGSGGGTLALRYIIAMQGIYPSRS